MNARIQFAFYNVHLSAGGLHSSVDSEGDVDVFALMEVYLGPIVNMLHSVGR